MKTTYEKVLTFALMANAYLQRVKGQKTKLAYAIERVIKGYSAQTAKLEAAYKERLEELDIEHCSVDDRGNIIEPICFTKDAQRARLKGQREARKTLLEAEVEVEPYMATQLPDDLTDAEREAFAGFVLPEVEEFEEQVEV